MSTTRIRSQRGKASDKARAETLHRRARRREKYALTPLTLPVQGGERRG